MGSLIELMNSVKKINYNQLVDESLKELEKYIIELNTIKQLYDKGIDSMGQPLIPYAPSTIIKKRRKGQPSDRTTYKDTGRFYRKFEMTIDKDFAQIFSTSPSALEVLRREGTDDVYGLTKENTVLLATRLKAVIQNNVRMALGL